MRELRLVYTMARWAVKLGKNRTGLFLACGTVVLILLNNIVSVRALKKKKKKELFCNFNNVVPFKYKTMILYLKVQVTFLRIVLHSKSLTSIPPKYIHHYFALISFPEVGPLLFFFCFASYSKS